MQFQGRILGWQYVPQHQADRDQQWVAATVGAVASYKCAAYTATAVGADWRFTEAFSRLSLD
jgi:hypothetical protein